MKMYPTQIGAVLGCILSLQGMSLQAATSPQERADDFLKLVNASYQALYRVESEAQWLAAPDVSPEHDAASETTGKARAAFNGNPAIISEARELLKEIARLKPLTVRELEQVLLNAAAGDRKSTRLNSSHI